MVLPNSIFGITVASPCRPEWNPQTDLRPVLLLTRPEDSARTFWDSLPEALRRRHALKPGTWGKLEVLSGSLVYVDLAGDEGFPAVIIDGKQ